MKRKVLDCASNTIERDYHMENLPIAMVPLVDAGIVCLWLKLAKYKWFEAANEIQNLH